jgi:hypothetical protein
MSLALTRGRGGTFFLSFFNTMQVCTEPRTSIRLRHSFFPSISNAINSHPALHPTGMPTCESNMAENRKNERDRAEGEEERCDVASKVAKTMDMQPVKFTA